MNFVKAASLYFALVFGTGFVLGAIRVSLLVPRLGERYAELLEMPLMFVAIVVTARYVIRRFRIAALPSSCVLGFGALLLLVMAELLLAVVLQDRSLAEYIASRDPISGSVYLIMLLVFALMPAFVARSVAQQQLSSLTSLK